MVVSIVAILLALTFLPPARLWNRAWWQVEYGTVSATTTPPRLQYCGAEYFADLPVGTLSQAAALQAHVDHESRTPVWPLGKVGSTPGRTAIVAPVPPSGRACRQPTDVFVDNGHGRYTDYILAPTA
jgi:hypothetical protein